MIRAAVATVCGTVLLAACGSSSVKSSTSTKTSTPTPIADTTSSASAKPVSAGQPGAAGGTTVKLVSSQYGQILADRRGQAFYLFGKDSRLSQCYGDCAHRWPPVIAKGTPQARQGAQSRLLGTTRRRDGRLQLTYRGHPLYYYDADSPGRVLCQNVSEFGGLWLVIRSNGTTVR
jgi:predicted lipoprotein with Yx(FWY)xxD motif